MQCWQHICASCIDHVHRARETNDYQQYLSDCQKAASQALGNAIALLASISNYTGSQEHIGPSFDTWNETIRKDLEYLQARLRDVDAKVAELRSLVNLFISCQGMKDLKHS